MIELKTPISDEEIKKLKVGDRVTISGRIYTGRDAVLPQLVKLAKSGKLIERGIQLQGSVIFHTAVSPVGVGPTSSNKYEIESCFEILSREGVRLHLGKGAIGSEAVKILDDYQSVFAVIAPVTALLTSRTLEKKVIAFPELGMEALHELVIEGYPAIIAAAHNQTIY